MGPNETEWVEGNWSAVKVGDRVKLSNADGELNPFTVSKVYQTRDCWKVESDVTDYSEWHWNLFVPAPSTPEIPTEPGFYVDRWNFLWELELPGGFVCHTETSRRAEGWLPFTRLESRADTAKAVIERVLYLLDPAEGSNTLADFGHVTTAMEMLEREFGVAE